ncbi:MAG: SgcJ/EcaC family oxidoreductase [Bacteroidota bacterium]|nr:SgcJ/EcaC family oxidoreductase [Bacteroidota bacterium]
MKSLALLFCTVLIFSIVCGQTSSDEKQVRSVIQKMEDAWNAHDYSYTGQYDIYDSKAVLVNPVGMYWKNRADIVKGIQAFSNMMFKYETAKYHTVDVHFLAPAVALVVIQAKNMVNEDYNTPDGSKGGSKGDTSESTISLTLAKKNNDWKITSQQVTSVDEKAAPFNPIK